FPEASSPPHYYLTHLPLPKFFQNHLSDSITPPSPQTYWFYQKNKWILRFEEQEKDREVSSKIGNGETKSRSIKNSMGTYVGERHRFPIQVRTQEASCIVEKAVIVADMEERVNRAVIPTNHTARNCLVIICMLGKIVSYRRCREVVPLEITQSGDDFKM
nr:hypothetical protein [Tanacetum cinerariifolium]